MLLLYLNPQDIGDRVAPLRTVLERYIEKEMLDKLGGGRAIALKSNKLTQNAIWNFATIFPRFRLSL
ncbi:hypothetical protein NIES22_68870 (plasmid) [Calothrix brevissima NIES-22]|nr:hypothetical protein NIES22_68870 [Calothrix brevissima NIES-22]